MSSVVYYKLKSAKDYKSLAIDGRFITVELLKQEIYDVKRLGRSGRGTDDDLVVTDAQTNREYSDEGMPIHRCTSLLIQRIPRHPRMRIVVESAKQKNNSDDNAQASSATSAVPVTFNDLDLDDFGDDPYAVPAIQSSTGKGDEDKLIKALIDTPAFNCKSQRSDDDFGQGMTGTTNVTGVKRQRSDGFDNSLHCSFSRVATTSRVGFEKKTPPEGYICHRCKVPGHFIQHCPTNGDTTFDVKRVKSPTGIEIEGIPSTRSVSVLPPELHCPVCKEVMKDAALTKCCFTSFCDRCIRDHTISKSMCVCGATNVLADDIFPNKTLRDTINRILESGNNSDEYSVGRSKSSQVQDMESYNPQAKVPSPTQSSAASKEQKVAAQVLSQREAISSTISEHVSADKGRTLKVSGTPEAIRDSRVSNEAVSQKSSMVKQEVQHTKFPCTTVQDLAPEHYMTMATRSVAFGPYWNRMQQPGFDGFMPLYPGSVPMDLSKLATGLNAVTPIMSRKQSETRRTDLKRKCERGFPELSKRSKQCC